jgi:hypothetical protein
VGYELHQEGQNSFIHERFQYIGPMRTGVGLRDLRLTSAIPICPEPALPPTCYPAKRG